MKTTLRLAALQSSTILGRAGPCLKASPPTTGWRRGLWLQYACEDIRHRIRNCSYGYRCVSNSDTIQNGACLEAATERVGAAALGCRASEAPQFFPGNPRSSCARPDGRRLSPNGSGWFRNLWLNCAKMWPAASLAGGSARPSRSLAGRENPIDKVESRWGRRGRPNGGD